MKHSEPSDPPEAQANAALERTQPARGLAALVLERVTDKGAYASRALDAELERARLDARDAALATEIIYGALRVLPALDEAIERHVARGLANTDSYARAVLRCAAYQLLHLDRVPAHAVVHESVSLVRQKRGPKVGGFVNAVLRKLATQRPGPAAGEDRTAGSDNTTRALVVPDWMRQTLRTALGEERLARFLQPTAATPALCLRDETGDRSALLARLSLLGSSVASLETISPLCVLLRRAGAPRALPGYAEGAFSVQEEGAQLVALALAAQPGERVADVCAGHGGKTTLLARQVGAQGEVWALDIDERKLRQIPQELTRLGLPSAGVHLHPVDLSVGVGGLHADFDRVLVDAPCTGLGTVHRRPELLLRLRPADPARLALLQLSILQRAAALVKPGGVLGYAVCSPTHAEGAEVARQFEAAQLGFTRVLRSLSPHLPAPDSDGVLRIGGWLAAKDGSSCPDAYQVVLWQRSL